MLKFSPDGKVLWETPIKLHCNVPRSQLHLMMNSPSLWGDAIIGSLETGSVFALSMATGQELWSTQLLEVDLPRHTTSNGFVSVHDGVVVTATFYQVCGVNATDGSRLWDFRPDMPVWNFLASFPDDGTVIFQDWTGKVYRLRLPDGTLLWKVGGFPDTWTDGSAIVAPNGLVYAVNTLMPAGAPPSKPFAGSVAAYRLSTGERVWERKVAKQPNNVPAVVRLGKGQRLSVVQATGNQAQQGAQFDVLALDAETGEQQWVFHGPTQVGKHQGEQDIDAWLQEHIQPSCIPNPWSAPSIDSTGTVYIANQEGPIFALKDVNGDGKVEGEGEVDSYETFRAFCGSEAPSFAPGIMAIASCDTMYVFRWPEESAATA